MSVRMGNRRAAKKWANDVVAAALMTAGCGGSIIASDGLTPPGACDSNGERSLDGLTPAQPVDYLEMRSVADQSLEESTGTKCATASDQNVCSNTVATTKSASGMETCESGGPIEMCKGHYFVFTRGDQVGTITTLAELGAFLAPIDTPQEAVLLVTLANHTIECTLDSNGDKVGTRPSPDGDGFDLVNIEGGGCADTFRVEYHVAKDGTVTETAREKIANGTGMCPVARRSGASTAPSRSGAGGWFARAAWLEAESVPAFERLHAELRALGAPRSLLSRARRAARQEASHARAMKRLAKRFGADAKAPRKSRKPALRSAEAIAIENAAEGCVRETFGAVFASFMARAARDTAVRAAMTRIARDELDHAILARDVARFLEPRLSADARERAHAARESALAELRAEIGDAPAELVARAGFPTAVQTRALLDAASPVLLGALGA